ncbi:hypothetical protein Vretimale_7355 [Volvox reticuliferus]|uniref:Protein DETOXIFICATION n=1 Tax=Volvox reticuliferus TaxID=1737510 RepID=A0A8J4G9B3_9CHLO|nr:hypothetical protein Vretifemale_7261 [Volvox reticuliferus]GIM02544.1 hypothetical protein Vretimale_7355 [Volvox reticuliferus]
MQSAGRDSALRAPLLDPFEAYSQQGFHGLNLRESFRRMATDFCQQLSLAGPLAVNLVTANAVAVTNLYFVARGGTVQLATAALGNNVAIMFGRLVLLGLCGALDTLAAQAWGAGKERRLPLLLQRTVLFLWLHCVLISAAMLMLPAGLQALGQDPGLGAMLWRYLLALLPSVWLEALSRPINRALVARGIVTPQMVISLVGLPLTVATTYALVVAAGWEYMGAALAMSAAAGYDVILLLLYVAGSGQWANVVGTPSRKAFKGWRQLARLAYPAASMKCAESWAFTICTLAASLLPDACTATAAVGVSYNVYGVLFISFVACATAACVTVGNKLGAGDPGGAKLAAAGSLLIVPPAWGLAAVALLVTPCQNAILALFATGEEPGGDDPTVLRGVLRHMFVIVAGLVLLDGIQTVLSGVIQGCGRQHAGALVNLVAFYIFALPLALFLAFSLPLPPGLGGGLWGLGLGPEGLYLGMAAGPAIQTVSYTYILLRTNWRRVAQAAVSAAALNSASSFASLLRRLDSGGLMGPPLIRSAASSGHGMGSFTGASSARLPIIQEHMREGRDSSDSFGAGAVPISIPISDMAASGSALVPASAPAPVSTSFTARMNSWLQANKCVLAGAFPGGGGGDGEVDEELSYVGASSDDEDDDDDGGGGGDGVLVAADVPLNRKRSYSRLRPVSVSNNIAIASAASGKPLAALEATAAGLLLPCADDESPSTTALSQPLIMTRGSPPLTERAQHCLLAATLEPYCPAPVEVARRPAAAAWWARLYGAWRPLFSKATVAPAEDPPELAVAAATDAVAAAASAPMQLPGVVGTAGPFVAVMADVAGASARGMSSPVVMAASPLPITGSLAWHAAAAASGSGSGSGSGGALGFSRFATGSAIRASNPRSGCVASNLEPTISPPPPAMMVARGEVFRSCESLAAAVPSSEDVYAFSASAGTDGGSSWFDPPASFYQDPIQMQQQTRLPEQLAFTMAAACDGYGGGRGGGGGGDGDCSTAAAAADEATMASLMAKLVPQAVSSADSVIVRHGGDGAVVLSMNATATHA